ncbi:hypothetical protein GC177_09475 [bacterium]|nr:hypothetical protein [bacterium]
MASHWFENEEYDKPAGQINDPFGPLPLAYRRWLDKDAIRYKVYSETGKYTMVLATTAAQAIRLSGIEKPLKVERYLIDNQVEAPEEAMTETEGVYVRPILEKLADESPVVDYGTMQALIEKDEQAAPLDKAPPLQDAAPETVEETQEAAQAAPSTVEEQALPEPVNPEEQASPEAQPVEDDLTPPSLKSILAKDTEQGGEEMSIMPDVGAAPEAVPAAKP